MRHPSLLILPALVLLISIWLEAEQPGQAFTVHGRLSHANGNARCVIWIVGTNRRLAVLQSSDEVPEMPEGLWWLLSSEDKYRDIYANFVVEPATPYKKGVRQWVRIISVSDLVVMEKDKIILQKKTL
jgi:hypothetical protein